MEVVKMEMKPWMSSPLADIADANYDTLCVFGVLNDVAYFPLYIVSKILQYIF